MQVAEGRITIETAEGEEASLAAVTPEHIALEVNFRTGIPVAEVSADDMKNLKALPDTLNGRLIGQPEAIAETVKAIRRGRLGYKEEKAPVGVFVALGPTGVGKTEFVRVLAQNQYGSEKNIVRIDMSEYMEKHSVSKLISAPPGYVGHEAGGQLTEPVRRNPHTVVLFDEIEKAHPDVLNVLLQVIEDGRLTDGQGRTVDFSNAILVMTSNIGGSLAAPTQRRRKMGFRAPGESEYWDEGETGEVQGYRENYLAAFKQAVRPEFFNRIGKRRVLVFNQLGEAELDQILGLRINDLNARLSQKGMHITLSAEARRRVLADGASKENQQYGARPLKQAIEHDVEDALVDAELDGRIQNGDKVIVDYIDGEYIARTDKRGVRKMSGLVMAAPLAALALPSGWVLPALGVIAGVVASYFVIRAVRKKINARADKVRSDELGNKADSDRAPPKGEVSAPKQKVTRAIRIGAITAIAMLALDMAVFAGATALGYEFHASYQTPEFSNPEAFAMFGDTIAFVLAKIQMLFMGAGLAPYWEEVAFRAGVIGMSGVGAVWLAKKAVWLSEKFTEKAKAMRPWILPAAFGIAATEAALFFTVLHEVSDPVLISIRVAQALLFSYLYVREGLVSGMVHHSVFNGLAILTMPLFMGSAGAILVGPAAGLALGFAAVAGALWYFTKDTAKKENAEIKAGTLSPYRLSARASILLGRIGWASVLVLGGLAAIQTTPLSMLLVGSMALQVAPFAYILGVYGKLLDNLQKREGQEAVNAIRNPENPLPLYNKIGRQTGGIIMSGLVGVAAGGWLTLGVLHVLPTLGLWQAAGVGALVPAAVGLGILLYRLFKAKKGVSPILYGVQTFSLSSAMSAFGMPAAAMLMGQGGIDKMNEAAAGLQATATASPEFAWMMPAFLVLSVLMAIVGKRIADKLKKPGASSPAASLSALKAVSYEKGNKAWLATRYKPILTGGILAGFSLSVLGFVAFIQTLPWLAALTFVGGIVAGTLAGDRLARGSLETVRKRYDTVLSRLPGVRRIGTENGSLVVYYESEAALAKNASQLPTMIDGYDVVSKAVETAPVDSVSVLEVQGREGMNGLLSQLPGFAPVAPAISPATTVMRRFSFQGASVQLAAESKPESDAALGQEDVLYYHQTYGTINRFLDAFVKENTGWWSRLTGKQALVSKMTDAFRQEIRRGRKPAFEISFTEDGVKKVLRGPNGETAAEILWKQLKSQTRMSEDELSRFLSIARRIHGERVTNLGAYFDAWAPSFNVTSPRTGIIERAVAAFRRI